MKYLTFTELRSKLGNRSRSAIYLDLEAGRLPQPVKLGGRFYWPEGEVDAHLRNLNDRALDMSGGQNETPHDWQADTGEGNRYANAAGTLNVTQAKEHAKCAGHYCVTLENGKNFTIETQGREAWALDRLRLAGLKGCTPIEQPAPRWSAYIHNLRKRGVPIDTLHEPHGGAFSGTHGRYVLRAIVKKGGKKC